MSVRYSYIQPAAATLSPHDLHDASGWRTRSEDLDARERRIFGGVDHNCIGDYDWSGNGDDDDAMKKGMLDVVLGLFDGLDYDDEAFLV